MSSAVTLLRLVSFGSVLVAGLSTKSSIVSIPAKATYRVMWVVDEHFNDQNWFSVDSVVTCAIAFADSVTKRMAEGSANPPLAFQFKDPNYCFIFAQLLPGSIGVAEHFWQTLPEVGQT